MGAGRAMCGVVAIAGLVAACGASDDRPTVLGVSISATTTTGPVIDSTPGVVPGARSDTIVVPPATAPPPPVQPAPQTLPPPPTTAAPTTTTEPPPPSTTVPGESLLAGTYVETEDQANSYSVGADGTTQASSIEITRSDATERVGVVVMYFGADVEVQLTNLADRTIVLTDGFDAAVECRRDGQPWQSVHAVSPSITSVDPGATIAATAPLAADVPGTYDCTATTTIVLP